MPFSLKTFYNTVLIFAGYKLFRLFWGGLYFQIPIKTSLEIAIM